jgi:RNA polymerase sigma factor (sigma-70 family)
MSARASGELAPVAAPRRLEEERLAREGRAIVNEVAGRIHRRLDGWIPIDDLVSIGNEALARLVREYERERAPFAAYLRQHLRWAIVGAIRRRSYGYPAAMRAKALGALEELASPAGAKLGDGSSATGPVPASSDEATDALRIALARRADAMAIGLLAGHAAADEAEALADSSHSPERVLARRRLCARLRQLVDELRQPRARALLAQHYFDDQPLAAVGEALGLDKFQTTRLHRRALAWLAPRLRAAGLGPEPSG